MALRVRDDVKARVQQASVQTIYQILWENVHDVERNDALAYLCTRPLVTFDLTLERKFVQTLILHLKNDVKLYLDQLHL